MKLYPECVPCMLKRAIMFCEGESDETKKQMIKEVCDVISEMVTDPKTTTTSLAFERNQIIEKLTDNSDPLRELKDVSFDAAMKLYPKLKDYVAAGKNPAEKFKRALRVAMSGNIIEFGARDHKIDIKKLEDHAFEAISQTPAIDDSEKILEKVKNAREILYVTDNSGEVVFDRVLIEELLNYAKVYVAPLSRPVQDDACIHEIEKAGIDKICPVILRGNFLGIWFDMCTDEFIRKFDETDFIIAKGMGCYETLMDYPEKHTGKIGLLLKVKCLPVAKNIGVPLGSAVIKLL